MTEGSRPPAAYDPLLPLNGLRCAALAAPAGWVRCTMMGALRCAAWRREVVDKWHSLSARGAVLMLAGVAALHPKGR